jgi:hypothetical protein
MGLYCESNISPLCYPNLGHVEDACSCLRVLWLLSSSFISLTNPCIKTYWYLIPWLDADSYSIHHCSERLPWQLPQWGNSIEI